MNFKSLVLLGLSVTTIGTSIILGAATQASAKDVKAGPIWNNEDAQIKCPVAAAAVGGEWNGQWRTTIWGKESVCGVNRKPGSPALTVISNAYLNNWSEAEVIQISITYR